MPVHPEVEREPERRELKPWEQEEARKLAADLRWMACPPGETREVEVILASLYDALSERLARVEQERDQGKRCHRCKEWKLYTEFYADRTSGRAGGVKSFCKACDRELGRQRRRDKAAAARSSRAYRERNREKQRAKEMIRNELEQGRLTRALTCSECGKERPVEGHHDDYSKPLEVRWLCRDCHKAHHAKERSMPEQWRCGECGTKLTPAQELCHDPLHLQTRLDDVRGHLAEAKAEADMRLDSERREWTRAEAAEARLAELVEAVGEATASLEPDDPVAVALRAAADRASQQGDK